jgi:predicted DNA-binding transcriptional regulator YafY
MIMHALQTARGYGVDDLAELVGVDRRTVFRDLELLKRSGIHFSYDRPSQRYRLARDGSTPPVHLTHSEALALLLSLRQSAAGGVLPDIRSFTSAGIKIESVLPAPLQDYCGRLLAEVDFKPRPVSDSSSVLDTLLSLQLALAERNKVAIHYDSLYDGGVIETVIRPYRIAHLNRGWYIIAHSEHVDAVRMFKLERLIQMQVLEERYEIDDEFSLERYLGNAWMMIPGDREYHVRIRFHPQVASNVDEVCWHPTQQTRWEDDGWLTFEVDVQGIGEISWWVLGYGDRAQVLDPPELREAIAERVAGMYQHYHAADSP